MIGVRTAAEGTGAPLLHAATLRISYKNPYIEGQEMQFFIPLLTISSMIFGPRGGCASSRLDHSSKTLPERLH